MAPRREDRPYRGDIAKAHHEGETVEGVVVARTGEAISLRIGHEEKIVIDHEDVIEWEPGGEKPKIRLGSYA